MWIKQEQSLIIRSKNYAQLKVSLNLFHDKDGLIRLQGRLSEANMAWDSKHPVLLRQDSYYTYLVILSCHHKVKWFILHVK